MKILAVILVMLFSLALAGPVNADDDEVSRPVCGPAPNVREWLAEHGMQEVLIGKVTDSVMASLWRSDERFAFFSQHVSGAACIHALGAENWFVEPKEEEKEKKSKTNFEIRSLPNGSKYVWVGINIKF